MRSPTITCTFKEKYLLRFLNTSAILLNLVQLKQTCVQSIAPFTPGKPLIFPKVSICRNSRQFSASSSAVVGILITSSISAASNVDTVYTTRNIVD